MKLFKNKNIERLEMQIESLKMDISRKDNEIQAYKEILLKSSCSTLLLEENQKLIKWIHDILEQFGTMEVRTRDRIVIPVYKKINFSESMNPDIQRTRCETVVIPEIVIKKIG